jgi:hypothetical protein
MEMMSPPVQPGALRGLAILLVIIVVLIFIGWIRGGGDN